jgi:predicted transcriptional regulator
MTRREILALVHELESCTAEAVATSLGLEPSVTLTELRALATLGIVKCEGEPTEQATWRAMFPTLDDAVGAMERAGEDPDLEITTILPLVARQRRKTQ